MARLANKSATQRAPQTSAAVPELPDFAAEFASLPGGQKTNASLQRWWDLVRQRIEFTNASNNGRMREFTRTIDGITGSITEIIEIQSDQEDYLEASWTIRAQAGPIVTGMKLFSATGPATEVSYISFQADRFQVNTATGGNKQIFSASSTAVKLGDVLTVDLTNAKVFIGTGTYNNSNTAFYVDDDGYFSLKGKLSFDPTGTGTLSISGTVVAGAGEIGGWTINSTTLSKNSAILDSAGQLVLGSSNNVVYLSATDATYRIWIGNATAGSAAFRVTKAGAITATSGTIGGWALSSTTLTGGVVTLDSSGSITSGSGTNYVSISSAGLQVGASSTATQVFVKNNGGNTVFQVERGSNIALSLAASGTAGNERATMQFSGYGTSQGSSAMSPIAISVFNASGSGTLLSATSGSGGLFSVSYAGTTSATLFSGPGSSLTALNAGELTAGTIPDARFPSILPVLSGVNLTNLNASNIASGTISNSRLPSAVSVTSLATANFFANSGATSVDFAGANLRGFSDAGRVTQTFRVDAANGDIYINSVRVVRAQYGTVYPGGGADAAGLWAKDCLIYHGLGM